MLRGGGDSISVRLSWVAYSPTDRNAERKRR
jgi:hypothetical protein